MDKRHPDYVHPLADRTLINFRPGGKPFDPNRCRHVFERGRCIKCGLRLPRMLRSDDDLADLFPSWVVAIWTPDETRACRMRGRVVAEVSLHSGTKFREHVLFLRRSVRELAANRKVKEIRYVPKGEPEPKEEPPPQALTPKQWLKRELGISYRELRALPEPDRLDLIHQAEKALGYVSAAKPKSGARQARVVKTGGFQCPICERRIALRDKTEHRGSTMCIDCATLLPR